MEEKKDEEVLGLDADEAQGDDLSLVCKVDGTSIKISRKAVGLSDLLMQALEGDAECMRIEIDHIAGPVATKAVEYMEHAKDNTPTVIPSPLPSTVLSFLSEYETKFVNNLDQKMSDPSVHRIWHSCRTTDDLGSVPWRVDPDPGDGRSRTFETRHAFQLPRLLQP